MIEKERGKEKERDISGSSQCWHRAKRETERSLFTSVELQPITSRLPTNEQRKANRKWRWTNTRGWGETRNSKKYLQDARNSHTMHPTQDIALFETGARVKNLPKYFVSGPSILRDTDFDMETGDPLEETRQDRMLDWIWKWKASIFHRELMMRVDDESVKIFYWVIRFNKFWLDSREDESFFKKRIDGENMKT